MVIISLLSWWYGPGWRQTAVLANRRLVRMTHVFSLPILIRTLWAPWRRIVTYPGASFDAKLRALGDNFVSRIIGFTVRMLVLIAAALIVLLTLSINTVLIILWPLVPLAIIALFSMGIAGMLG